MTGVKPLARSLRLAWVLLVRAQLERLGREMKRLASLLLCPMVSMVLVVAVDADQLIMKNGDRLTGEIVKADSSTLVIKLEYAPDLSVKAEAVSEITSD